MQVFAGNPLPTDEQPVVTTEPRRIRHALRTRAQAHPHPESPEHAPFADQPAETTGAETTAQAAGHAGLGVAMAEVSPRPSFHLQVKAARSPAWPRSFGRPKHLPLPRQAFCAGKTGRRRSGTVWL
jgi:hypothetical protein